MPKQVNIHEAKTHLSRLVDRVEKGESIVIARAGRPAAQLVPLGHSASDAGTQSANGVLLSEERTVEPIRDVWDDRSRQVAEAVEPYGSSRPAGPIPAGSSHALAAIVGRIVRLVDPERIVLFGSRARGDAREDSDYDLLVVMDQIDDRRATRLALRGALDDLPISKDIVVATVEEVEGRSGRPWGVLHWAIRDGRTIYDRV